jgi:hypothetical protein
VEYVETNGYFTPCFAGSLIGKMGTRPYHRKMVETAGSLIEQLLPKSMHAVTSQGFELKVALFVIAYSLNCYLNL